MIAQTVIWLNFKNCYTEIWCCLRLLREISSVFLFFFQHVIQVVTFWEGEIVAAKKGEVDDDATAMFLVSAVLFSVLISSYFYVLVNWFHSVVITNVVSRCGASSEKNLVWCTWVVNIRIMIQCSCFVVLRLWIKVLCFILFFIRTQNVSEIIKVHVDSCKWINSFGHVTFVLGFM